MPRALNPTTLTPLHLLFIILFKLNQFEACVWTIQQWLVYCFDCQGERVRSIQANDPDAWCQEIGNDSDAIMPRALKPMTLRHNVKSQSWGPDAGADTFKIKVFHKISISISLQKVEILKKNQPKRWKGTALLQKTGVFQAKDVHWLYTEVVLNLYILWQICASSCLF